MSFSIFTASTADISASEAQDPELKPASRSQSTVFDEDKPQMRECLRIK